MNAEMIRKILSHIDEHICEKISLSELAELAGYSPFYFSKLFSEAMGLPVTGYIRMRKLQYALCSLLEGKKVLDVSLMYAFDSHEGFTRSFTQLFGSTPSTVRKYLTSYRVSEWVVLDVKSRRLTMKLDKDTLFDDMHQLIFEIVRTSLEETRAGYCNKINIALLQNGRVEISDNGRGIPLSKDQHINNTILDKILAGHPISCLEYARMGDFSQCSMQTVNSLCESLQVNVYRNGIWFRQDYVRGIAQHEVICRESDHTSGTTIILKTDKQIFGETAFSADNINRWIKENIDDSVSVTIDQEK